MANYNADHSGFNQNPYPGQNQPVSGHFSQQQQSFNQVGYPVGSTGHPSNPPYQQNASGLQPRGSVSSAPGGSGQPASYAQGYMQPALRQQSQQFYNSGQSGAPPPVRGPQPAMAPTNQQFPRGGAPMQQPNQFQAAGYEQSVPMGQSNATASFRQGSQSHPTPTHYSPPGNSQTQLNPGAYPMKPQPQFPAGAPNPSLSAPSVYDRLPAPRQALTSTSSVQQRSVVRSGGAVKPRGFFGAGLAPADSPGLQMLERIRREYIATGKLFIGPEVLHILV